MNEIAMLALTITANALITGVLLFVFQKRMEESLSKRLFEHQIKFSRSYPKTLEVIETLNDKFHHYLERCSKLSQNLQDRARRYELIVLQNRPNLDEELEKVFEFDEELSEECVNLDDLVTDMNSHLGKSLIYLPYESAKELSSIMSKLFMISFHFNHMHSMYKTHGGESINDSRYLTSILTYISDSTQISFDDIKGDDKKVLDIVSHRIYLEMVNLFDNLNQHYKLVVDTKPN
jgi:hypothetical protein